MIQFAEAPGKPVLDELATVRKDIDLFAGWLTALPNPDKILREQPARGIRIYQDMLRDSHIRSVVGTRRLAVLGKEWRIEAAEDSPADQNVRDLVEEAIQGIRGFERARRDLLDGIFKGFAVGEIMWSVVNGRVVPTEIRRRGQHRFVFDADGRLRLLTIQNMEAEYRREQSRGLSPLTEDEKAVLRSLVGDVPALWRAADTTLEDRKRLLRCLLREVLRRRDG